MVTVDNSPIIEAGDRMRSFRERQKEFFARLFRAQVTVIHVPAVFADIHA
jgi:hypothetical protein